MTILTIGVNGMDMMLERSDTPRHVTLEDKLVELMDIYGPNRWNYVLAQFQLFFLAQLLLHKKFKQIPYYNFIQSM
jgi:hypothetical protein